MDDVMRQWEHYDGNADNSVSWEEFRTATFGDHPSQLFLSSSTCNNCTVMGYEGCMYFRGRSPREVHVHTAQGWHYPRHDLHTRVATAYNLPTRLE